MKFWREFKEFRKEFWEELRLLMWGIPLSLKLRVLPSFLWMTPSRWKEAKRAKYRSSKDCIVTPEYELPDGSIVRRFTYPDGLVETRDRNGEVHGRLLLRNRPPSVKEMVLTGVILLVPTLIVVLVVMAELYHIDF